LGEERKAFAQTRRILLGDREDADAALRAAGAADEMWAGTGGRGG
jgi:hypothetical protein